MNDKQETIADIIAEMRDRKEMLVNAISSAPLCYPVDDMKAKVEILDEFIDRIEAAHERDLAHELEWERINADLEHTSLFG